MKKLLILALLFCGFSIVKAQTDSIWVYEQRLGEEIYKYESQLYMDPNVGVKLITPKGDIIYIRNVVKFSNEKSPNFLGNCVYAGINPKGLGIILISVVVNTSLEDKWKMDLPHRGQSEIIWKRIALPFGDTLVLREIYRRRFDCGFYLWYSIEEKRGN